MYMDIEENQWTMVLAALRILYCFCFFKIKSNKDDDDKGGNRKMMMKKKKEIQNWM